MKKLSVAFVAVTSVSLMAATLSIGAIMASNEASPDPSQSLGSGPVKTEFEPAAIVPLSVQRNARYQSPYQILAALNALGIDCPGGPGYQLPDAQRPVFTGHLSCGKDAFAYDISTFSTDRQRQRYIAGAGGFVGGKTGLTSVVSGPNWVVTSFSPEFGRAVVLAIGGKLVANG